MKLRFLSSALLGQSLILRAEQGTQTAGPLNVSDLGGEPGTNAGPITITADRSSVQCAPDSVRFSVDLSAANFDTPGPANGEIYDPRLHDLVYLWDLGEDKDWIAPEKILDEWRSNRRAKGPWVSHVYAQPGTYTVKLTVLEPSSGKFAQAPDLPIDVINPNTAYPTIQTICINPVGDGDFTDAPAGAQLVNLDMLQNSTAIWDANKDGNPSRWLFKRDRQFGIALELEDNDDYHPYFGSYGTGTRPVLVPPSDGLNNNRGFEISPRFQELGGSVISDFRISELKFQGNFDPRTEAPTTATNKTASVLRTDKYLDLVIQGCEMRGMKNSTLGIYFDTNAPVPQAAHLHLDDCLITDMGGQYPVFAAPAINADSSISITGTRIAQNIHAADHEAEVRAPVRINHTAHTHIRGSDFFAYDRLNAGLKLINTPQFDGLLVNVQNLSVEGSLHPLQIAGNATQGVARSSVHNVIIDSAVVVGHYGSQTLIKSFASGLSVRNVLGVMPDIPRVGGAFQYALTLDLQASPPDHVLNAPTRFYNNTFIMRRSLSDNNNNMPTAYSFDAAYNAAIQDNNLLDGIWAEMPPSLGFLDETVLWTARNSGYTDKTTFALDSSFATGALSRHSPLLGSPVLGTVMNDLHAYDDITGTERPPYPSKGAWEVQPVIE